MQLLITMEMRLTFYDSRLSGSSRKLSRLKYHDKMRHFAKSSFCSELEPEVVLPHWSADKVAVSVQVGSTSK